ncbi:MAG TPA: FAD-dependent oxidoreductase [Chthonomonadaceae bacterium]|nr:FAD-dependent oxidoreductase [Chthonomonadaceae bacterium]
MDISRHPIKIGEPDYWKGQIRCQAACPVHTDVRGYVRAIAEGDLERAYLIARGPNPLASICGRICGAPCETNCRRGMIDQPVAIRALKRVVTERFGPYRAAQNGSSSSTVSGKEHLNYLLDHTTEQTCDGPDELVHLMRLAAERRPRPDGPRVAIIGAGPAGLACAHDLALLGLRPTLLEAESLPAGMLYFGVPEYRLPRELIKAEIEVIEALGVEIRCGVEVGKDVTLTQLREEYAAVVIAVGCKRSRGLPIPGADAQGMHGGVEFLRSVALRNPLPLGERVVVIGGGSVAYDVSRAVIRQEEIDVSRQALRQPGKREVQLVCLESRAEMPADETDIREGEEEGIQRRNGWGPVEILTEPGPDGPKVSGVRFRRCLRVLDSEGRFNPVYDDSARIDLPADTVILSVGQAVDLSFFNPDEDKLALTEQRQIAWDPQTQLTSGENVFIAGDVATGPKLVIHAIASGKRAARTVYERLTGVKLHPDAVQFHVDLGEFRREPDLDKRTRVDLPILPAEARLRDPRAIVELGYSLEEAKAEASRCLDCGVDTVFNGETCILCGACTEVCPTVCLTLRPVREVAKEEPFQSQAAAGHYHVQKNSIVLRDKDRSIEQYPQARIEANEDFLLFKDEDTCIRCGRCAQVCPTHTITMERCEFQEGWRPCLESE